MDRFAWLAVVLVSWGSANFLLKVVGTRIDSASGVFGIVAGYVIAGVMIGLSGGGRAGLSWAHGAAVIVGMFYIVGNWAFMRLARTTDITLLAPLAQMQVLIPIALGFLLLDEPVTLRKVAGIAFGLVAIVLLAGRR